MNHEATKSTLLNNLDGHGTKGEESKCSHPSNTGKFNEEPLQKFALTP